MATKKISEFFNGRYFEVPKYQRGYAWELRNIREFFDDINEAIETSSSHYLGTIVLSKTQSDDVFHVVDGQQRLTTITMLINSLVKQLPKKDRDYYHRFYIKDAKHRLMPLGKDRVFFERAILGSRSIDVQSKSQRLLADAHGEILRRIENIKDKSGFIRAVERLQIMEFVEPSEGDAIRIFQTVNDRGKPLSNMEKAKSLLIYFSNRYLNKQLDDMVNDKFGEIFEIYDDIKHLADHSNVTLIKSNDFTEDNIMRYHFVSFSDENFDATGSYVLEFLKRELSSLRNGGTVREKEMKKLISTYTDSLHSFFVAMKEVMYKVAANEKYYKLFAILGVSATLYPVLVKLQRKGILDDPLPKRKEYTFIDLIELIDVRVYKTRNTDPRAEVSRFASSIDDSSLVEIEDWLTTYNKRWMSKDEFQANISGSIYGNRALPHIFIAYSEFLTKKPFSLQKLQAITSKSPTIEHILSQFPKFNPKKFGFKDEEEYLIYEDKIGNLTVLEKSINSQAQNKNPKEKVPFYDRSIFSVTKKVSTAIDALAIFKKEHIDTRTDELAAFCGNRWWC